LALSIIYHFKLANAVPLEGSATYAEIAVNSGLSEEWCFRSVRVVIGHDIFDEDSEGRVHHTAISRRLATDQGFADAVGLQLIDLGPASSSLIKVWEKYGQDSVDPSQCAWSLYHGFSKPFFEVLSTNPERSRRYGGAMRYMTSGYAWDLRHLYNSFDWNQYDKPGSIIVDVGGGFGQISKYLAQETKHINFIVQDQEHVVSSAAVSVPENLKHRIKYEAHDFFQPQKLQGVAAFIIRWILHDWNHQDSVRILKGLVPAMRRGTKLLIYEYVLGDRPVKSASERSGLQCDMIMAVKFNTKERYARDFEKIVRDAHENFVLEQIKRVEGGSMSLMEIGWKG
jgi:hypothetical protein